MKSDILKQFVTMRRSLEEERVQVQARLKEIEAALGGEDPTPSPKVKGPAAVKGKRQMSAAGKARIIAGIKARWAKWRAEQAGGPAAKENATASRVISEAGRKRLAALAKARWAKVKASGKTKL